jgi:Cytochrome P450
VVKSLKKYSLTVFAQREVILCVCPTTTTHRTLTLLQTDGSALALIYALATNPDVQRKAQQEIDHVVGPGRLPDFGDFEQLPYIQALIKEVGRWHSVVPLCKSVALIYVALLIRYQVYPMYLLMKMSTWATAFQRKP